MSGAPKSCVLLRPAVLFFALAFVYQLRLPLYQLTMKKHAAFRPAVLPADMLQKPTSAIKLHRTDVTIALATEHWFTWLEGTHRCTFHGQPLTCKVGAGVDSRYADALLFHLPHIEKNKTPFYFPQKLVPEQLFVGVSREPTVKLIENATFMANFDYTSTVQLSSDIPNVYKPFDIRKISKTLPGFESRRASVAYLNSNCGSKTHTLWRHVLVQRLADEFGVPVDSLGACKVGPEKPDVEKDRPANWSKEKKSILKKYRVCIAMESTIMRDYVSEKVWGAIEAGCIPVYRGAPNAREDFLPATGSVIWVDDYDIEDLATEIKSVLNDEPRYQHYLAWRSLPFEELNKGYRAHLRRNDGPEALCQLCKLLAVHKGA